MTQRTIRTTNDELPSDTVIDAVAAATGTDPRELPQLYEVVDLDALDRLVGRDDRHRRTGLRIEFAVAGCDVTVEVSGRVVVVASTSGSQSQTAST